MNETTAATTKAIASNVQSSDGAPTTGCRNALKIFKALAASKVGIPTRNVNSVAAGRLNPSARAIRMVVPERDAPGKIAATSWPSPTAMTIGR